MVKPCEIKLPLFLKGLVKLGFILDKKASNHIKATNPKTNKATMIPRHKPVKKSIVRSDFIFLCEGVIVMKKLKKLLKLSSFASREVRSRGG